MARKEFLSSVKCKYPVVGKCVIYLSIYLVALFNILKHGTKGIVSSVFKEGPTGFLEDNYFNFLFRQID